MLLLPSMTRLNFCAAKLTSLVAFEHEKTPNVVGPWAAFAAWNPVQEEYLPLAPEDIDFLRWFATPISVTDAAEADLRELRRLVVAAESAAQPPPTR